MAASKLRVKLLVDKAAHKVLFAEANKEVVDFLFTLLTLPVGTVVKLVTKDSMVGSLGNPYNSVENLSETYMDSKQAKVSLLEPKLPTSVAQVHLFLAHPTSTTPDKSTISYYTCSNNCHHHNYFTNNRGTTCPTCNCQMTRVVVTGTAEEKPSGDGGYVKGLVTYMVMDDFSVTPISSIYGISLLNNFNVKEVGSLEEMEVDLGMDEGLDILKSSLQSKTVLTDVFLGKKRKQPSGESSAQ